MHLDLDTNYPYLISFYHDSVWCLAVTRPGRDCLYVAPLTPQRPDQYHHRSSRGGCYRGRGWEQASLHQRLSTYNQLRASAPPLHPDCGANVQAIVSHTWICINLQIISSHDT